MLLRLALCALSAILPAVANVAAKADSASAPPAIFAPSAAKGQVVIVISGQSGPTRYRGYSSELARQGYLAMLIDGNDVLKPDGSGGDYLKATIMRAQQSPNALPGKVEVVGFSLGGGGALSYATRLPELVSAVVAYYPATSSIKNMQDFVAEFKVPILVLAGGEDDYRNCCLAGTARSMDAAARELKLPFDLVVYPNANHGFNIAGHSFRAADAADAWQRTLAMLRQYQAK